jgi:Na+-driven multidrug efflux pump
LVPWISFEIMTIMVNEIGNDDQLAAHGALLGLILFFTLASNAVNVGASSFIGFAVGANLEKAVHNLIIICLSSVLLVTVIISAIG